MALALGLIPTWQFSDDPAVNININPHVKFPAGVNQLTPQPIGLYPTSGDANLQGLGITMAAWEKPPVGVPGFSGSMFTSSWWFNRRWLVMTLLGIAGVGAATFAIKTLR